MSGTPEWCASSTAGCRFATAVPDVVTTTRRATRLDRRAEREERRTALVDAHVQPDRADPLELGGREREGLRSGTGRHDDVAHARAHERAEQRHRGIARGAPPAGRLTGLRIQPFGRPEGPASPGASGASGCLRSVPSVSPLPNRVAGCRSRPGVRPAAPVPRAGAAARTGRLDLAGLVGVEFGELLLHAADALVLLGVVAQLAQELGVVVGGDRAAAARRADAVARVRGR